MNYNSKVSVLAKSFLIATFLMIIISTAAWCQPTNVPPPPDLGSLMASPNANFDTINDILKTYYDTYSDTSEAEGYTGYVRWRHFWERRAGTMGESTRDFDEAYAKYNSLIQQPLCTDNSSGDSFWAQIGPFEDIDNKMNRGYVASIAFDPVNPNIVYIGSNAGGLWKTTNFAIPNPVWINLTNTTSLPGLGINDIAIDPNNSNVIYIATGLTHHYGNHYGVGILKTTDGGLTWQSISPVTPGPGTVCNKIIIDHSDSDIIYTISGICFYKSTDGGNTWTSKCGATDFAWPEDVGFNDYDPNAMSIFVHDLEQHPTNPDILYVSSNCDGNSMGLNEHDGSIVVVSTDGGLTWTESDILLSGGTNSSFVTLSVNNDEPNALYAMFRDNSTKVYKTVNNGLNWTQVWSGSSNTSKTMNSFIVSSINPTYMYIGGLTIRKVTVPNSGQPFSSAGYNGNHADIRALELRQSTSPGSQTNQDKILCGNDGGISYTSNGITTNWENKNGSFSSQLMHGIGVSNLNPDLVLGGCQDNQNKVYGAGQWKYPQYSGGDGGEGIFDVTNPKVLYAEQWCCGDGTYNLRRWIQNASGDWQSASSFNPGIKANPNMPLQQLKDGRLYAGWKNLYKNDAPQTSFNSSSFDKISDFEIHFPNDTEEPITSFVVSETTDDVIYAAKSGPSWDGDNSSYFYKATTGGGINSGDWEDFTSNLPDAVRLWYGVYCMDLDPKDDDRIWIGAGGFGDNGSGAPPYDGSYRVIFSNNGGASFIDYSDNLPPFPVNDILYEPGSNDALYAATDVGVFYTNATIYPIDGWVCFGNHLPTNVINDIEINPCEGKIYASVYGQGVWESPLANSPDVANVVSGNTVIDNDRSYNSDLIVESGATLTINPGVTIAFGKDASLIVEQNGTFICDGCNLTNACDDFWAGIQVWGDVNENQYAYNGNQYHQGRAILKNNATIINALNGVQNWEPQNWNSRGGIILCENANFINCRRAAAFMSYQNTSSTNSSFNAPEQSHFYKCHFELNDDYFQDMDALIPKARITMWETDRLKIEGCTFLNTSTTASSEARSKAIFSSDANYLVREHCNDPFINPNGCQDETNNTFIGWHKAIEATGGQGFRPMLVRNSTFEKNMVGIEIKGAEDSEVYWNDFKMGNHPFLEKINFINNDENHVGVFTNNTKRFTIEENNFEKETNAQYQGHGVLVYNSDGNDNRVYHNTFSDLETGENGWQVNRNASAVGKIPKGGIGLQFLCNDNTGNEVDLEMSRSGSPLDNEYQVSGMRYEQGNYNPDQPAGNTFSSPDPDPSIYTHYTVSSDYNYLYVPDYGNVPASGETTPGKIYLTFTPGSNSCPLRYGSGPHGGLKTSLLANIGELQGLEYTYGEIIDGGNTQATLNEIALTWPEDAWDLRDELLSRSPYNSETVLIEAARKEIMPHAMLLEVLVSNPDALRSGSVIRVVETELTSPMPEYMVDMLHVAKDEQTLRTSMESAMANLHAQTSLLQKQALSQIAFKLDDIDTPDSTYFYQSKLHTLGNNYALAFNKSSDGDFTFAIDLLDSMKIHFPMEPFEKDECAKLIDLLSLLEANHNGGGNIANMDSTEIAALISIAEDQSARLAAVKAQNILCFHYDICYDPSGTLLNNMARILPKVYDEAAILDRLNQSKVYPSPADGYITVEYQLMKSKDNTVLNIYDNLARKVYSVELGEAYEGQEVIDTRRFTNGVYIMDIVQDGIQIEVNKFIVTH